MASKLFPLIQGLRLVNDFVLCFTFNATPLSPFRLRCAQRSEENSWKALSTLLKNLVVDRSYMIATFLDPRFKNLLFQDDRRAAEVEK